MSLPNNPARTARRKTELHERLASERPRCLYCGCTEPIALRTVTRKFFRDHHVFGRNHDPDSESLLCQNCHALAHENLLNAEVDLEPEPNPVKRVAKMLRAEAVHFEMLANTKRNQAELLERKKQ
jgi:hypothetical protein